MADSPESPTTPETNSGPPSDPAIEPSGGNPEISPETTSVPASIPESPTAESPLPVPPTSERPPIPEETSKPPEVPIPEPLPPPKTSLPKERLSGPKEQPPRSATPEIRKSDKPTFVPAVQRARLAPSATRFSVSGTDINLSPSGMFIADGRPLSDIKITLNPARQVTVEYKTESAGSPGTASSPGTAEKVPGSHSSESLIPSVLRPKFGTSTLKVTTSGTEIVFASSGVYSAEGEAVPPFRVVVTNSREVLVDFLPKGHKVATAPPKPVRRPTPTRNNLEKILRSQKMRLPHGALSSSSRFKFPVKKIVKAPSVNETRRYRAYTKVEDPGKIHKQFLEALHARLEKIRLNPGCVLVDDRPPDSFGRFRSKFKIHKRWNDINISRENCQFMEYLDTKTSYYDRKKDMEEYLVLKKSADLKLKNAKFHKRTAMMRLGARAHHAHRQKVQSIVRFNGMQGGDISRLDSHV